MLPTHRPPTSPGEMLLEEFLRPHGLTQIDMAKRMGVPIQRVNGIINGRRAISAETAILLAMVLGTSAEFWLGLQSSWDLWHAKQHMRKAEVTPVERKRRVS